MPSTPPDITAYGDEPLSNNSDNPFFDDVVRVARSATVVITKNDGGIIGT